MPTRSTSHAHPPLREGDLPMGRPGLPASPPRRARDGKNPFRLKGETGSAPAPTPADPATGQEEREDTPPPGDRWLCRFCRGPITTSARAMARQGSHRHTLFNPAGVVFELGCFRQAPGCRSQGVPTDHFTWFAGCVWQLALCRRCGNHLGWLFHGNAGESFYGLIYNRLIPES